ncbi:hypothetical protein MMC18_000185 [Xylographa bjoerkii]|nr:hypothetical protein [Xylographa bjoerkii]
MSRYGGGGGGERWDRERFERARGAPVVERERIFEERDRYAGGGNRVRESSVDEIYVGGGGGRRAPVRYEEKDRYIVEEKFARPSRPRGGPGRYYDEEGEDLEGSPNRGGQMVPFERRRQSITERFGPPAARRGPPRPTFIRRQSSLDTFDRKPMPRYGDRMREPPEVIAIPSRPRRRSPPRFMERDYEEVRVAEPEYYPEEEFRGYKEREIITERRRRADSEVREREEVYEEKEETMESPFPKKGKTKMPMRLINKRAVIELGYPFEEEGETLIILKALGKEHIDEVIKISREMNANGGETKVQESRKTYMIEAPSPPEEEEIVKRRTEIIREGPASEVPRSVREWDMMSNNLKSERSPSPGAKSAKSHKTSKTAKTSKSRNPSPSSKTGKSRHRSVSEASTRREIFVPVDDKDESATIHGFAGALQVHESRSSNRRDTQSIKAEIKALEAEKKALKYEREMEKERQRADRYRDSEIEIIRDKDVIKIEKDRKGRLSLVR